MRYFILFLTMCVVIFSGCGDDTPPVPGVAVVNLVSEDTNDCGYSVDPCSKTFHLEFYDTASAGEYWYWVKIVGNRDTAISKPVKLPNYPGPVEITGTANYFQFSNVVPDSCDIKVCSSVNAEDAGKLATRGCQAYDYRVEVPVFDNDCFQNCCTDQNLDKGWYYASAKQNTNDIVGVKAQILSRYGKLCGECAGSTDYTHQVVFVNISNEDGALIFAQTGYLMERLSGSTDWSFGVYAEIDGDTYEIEIDSIYRLPFEGSWHSYEVKLDYPDGVFKNYWDGDMWWDWNPQTVWNSKMGTSAQWTGEVYGRETDMAGTSQYPCSLNVCRSLIYGSGYQSPNFITDPNVRIGGTDLNEWGIDALGQELLKIWDKNVLPICK